MLLNLASELSNTKQKYLSLDMKFIRHTSIVNRFNCKLVQNTSDDYMKKYMACLKVNASNNHEDTGRKIFLPFYNHRNTQQVYAWLSEILNSSLTMMYKWNDSIITTEAVRIVAKCSRFLLGRGVCGGGDCCSVGWLWVCKSWLHVSSP